MGVGSAGDGVTDGWGKRLVGIEGPHIPIPIGSFLSLIVDLDLVGVGNGNNGKGPLIFRGEYVGYGQYGDHDMLAYGIGAGVGVWLGGLVLLPVSESVL